MSYDLYFMPPAGTRFDAPRFAALFADRAHYEVAGLETFYQNPDTGVYFSFDYAEGDPEDEDERFARPYVGFSVNLYRPDYFVLEAAAELAALIGDRFEVIDDQVDGIAGERFDAAQFVAGWRKANAVAYRAMSEHGTIPDAVLSRARNEAAWRWNHGRAALQAALGEAVFVPMLMFFAGQDGQAQRGFVWTTDVPTIVPDAADVAIVNDYPRRGLLARLAGKRGAAEIAGLVPCAGVMPLTTAHHGQRLLALDPDRDRARIDAALAQLRPATERLAADAVLDADTPTGAIH